MVTLYSLCVSGRFRFTLRQPLLNEFNDNWRYDNKHAPHGGVFEQFDEFSHEFSIHKLGGYIR